MNKNNIQYWPATTVYLYLKMKVCYKQIKSLERSQLSISQKSQN